MSKPVASAGSQDETETSFTEIGKDVWAFTAGGDPNSGVIIGDDAVMVVEAQATPRLARKRSNASARSPTSRSRISC